ncbi:MAG: endonuclease/exonuclease/phosphatase family protein [Planctomycetota bacterium]
MIRPALLVPCLLLPWVCAAQTVTPAAGHYRVEGTDQELGVYTARVELDAQGRLSGEARFADGAEGALSGRARAGRDGRLEVAATLSKEVEDRRGLSGVLAHVGVHRQRTLSRAGSTRYRALGDGWIGAYLARGQEDERRGVERWARLSAEVTVKLRVMTWNVLGFKTSWASREGKLAAVIRREAPDVLCLEEVNGVTRGRGTQAARLAKAAGGYEVVFEGARSRTFLGLGWEGNAILARGKVLERARFELPSGPAELHALGRVVVHARVELRPGVCLDVFATHLHQKQDDAGKAHRLDQGQAFLAWLRGRPDRGPRFIAGDFNEAPGGKLVPLLIGQGGFLDGWAAANPGQTGGTSSTGRRIDYLFFQDPARRKRARVLRAWTVGPNERGDEGPMLSDHRGIVADVELTLPRS